MQSLDVSHLSEFLHPRFFEYLRITPFHFDVLGFVQECIRCTIKSFRADFTIFILIICNCLTCFLHPQFLERLRIQHFHSGLIFANNEMNAQTELTLNITGNSSIVTFEVYWSQNQNPKIGNTQIQYWFSCKSSLSSITTKGKHSRLACGQR